MKYEITRRTEKLLWLPPMNSRQDWGVLAGLLLADVVVVLVVAVELCNLSWLL